jgi:hypothetical protein
VWDNLTDNTHLHGIIGAKINNGPALYTQPKHRSQTAMLVQLQTGHCGLNHYLAQFNKIESPECVKCGYEWETVEHFLLECPAYWEAREELRWKAGMARMSLSGLLGGKEVIKATLEYVGSTGRFVDDE